MVLIVTSNSNRGFTLVEFCVAVGILSVGLLGLLQCINVAFVKNRATIMRNEAVGVADSAMVDVKKTVYDDLSFNALATGVQSSVKLPFKNYSYSVGRVVTGTSVNSKQVEVVVGWWYTGKRYEHRISSLIVNPSQ